MQMNMNLDFVEEIHCDECFEVIHFHFDCPVCNRANIGTDQYCSVSDCFDDGGDFKCEGCNSAFRILKLGDNCYSKGCLVEFTRC